MAARRVPLERPPSQVEEKRLLREQEAVRLRLGVRLNKLRTDAHLSLRALAMKANASPSYLSEVERGLRAPTTDFLVRVGHFLGVSPASLISDEN
jgi:ribosome-binding protein aMBF1 (putative translation factor)